MSDNGPVSSYGYENRLGMPIWGLFLITLLVVLTLAKALFFPLVLALLISLTLSPIVRSLRRRGVPESLSAGLFVLLGAAAVAFIASNVAEPFSNWLDRFPAQLNEVREKLSGLLQKLTVIDSASDELSGDLSGDDDSAADRTVVTTDTSIVTTAATNLLYVLTTALVTTVLTYFLLAKGRVFYSRLLQQFSSLEDKKDALNTVYMIERSISRYLFTITAINMALGLSIGVAMWLLGMPNPVLWAIAATLLNYLPYIGALIGIFGSAVVAILTFEPLGAALVVPLVYALLTGVEGQVVTPTLIGRNLSINPVIVFFAVAMWSFMWGLAGALVAVPLLVVLNTVAHHVDQLSWIAQFIADEGEEDIAVSTNNADRQ